ncbi:MAG: peptidylprolyl isomerase [Planctomycetota bacterium]
MSSKRFLCLSGARMAIGLWLVVGSFSDAQTPDAVPTVVATVVETPILEAQVQRLLRGARRQRPATPNDRARALKTLIDQRLAALRLRELVDGATDAEIKAAFEAWKTGLQTEQLTEASYYQTSGMTRAAVLDEIEWQINWRHYVDRHVTSETKRDFFTRFCREFDGTKMKVQQIQWSLAANAPPDAALEQAHAVLARIKAGEMTFGVAAGRFSDAPSAAQQGHIGWIERNGPMHPRFCQAAFQLDVGEITAEPCVTPFGVHLIRCEEIQPGDRTLADCDQEVVKAMHRFLLRRLAQQTSTASGTEAVVWLLEDPRPLTPSESARATDPPIESR